MAPFSQDLEPPGNPARFNRAPDPELARLHQLEGPQNDHALDSGQSIIARPQSWRASGSTTSGPSGGGAIRRSARPGGGPGITSFRSSPSGDPQDDLHDQCGGAPAPVVAQDHQDARQLPGVRWRRRRRFPRHSRKASVTHVFGTICHLCLGPLRVLSRQARSTTMPPSGSEQSLIPQRAKKQSFALVHSVVNE